MSAASRERRERILAEGASLLSQEGLAGVTLGSLAERVGMSKSGLFAHFKSKEAVQLELLDHIEELGRTQVFEKAMAAREGLPQLRAYFEVWLGWAGRAGLPGGCPVAAAVFELDDLDGPVRERVVQISNRAMDQVLEMICKAVELDQLRKDADLEQILWEINGIYLAHHTSQRFARDPSANARAHVAFEGLLDRYLPRSAR